MPTTPIALRVPAVCIHCDRRGHVHLQTIVKGNEVVLRWCCEACNKDWAVQRREEVAASGTAPE